MQETSWRPEDGEAAMAMGDHQTAAELLVVFTVSETQNRPVNKDNERLR